MVSIMLAEHLSDRLEPCKGRVQNQFTRDQQMSCGKSKTQLFIDMAFCGCCDFGFLTSPVCRQTG